MSLIHKFLDTTFLPLKNANYRTYISGQAISLMGTFMQRTALQWLIWSITRDTKWIGIVGALADVPVFFLSPFTGSIADRVDRRKLLIAMQICEMLLAFVLGTLVLLGLNDILPVLIVAVALGVCTAFTFPAQSAFIGDLAGMGEVRRSMTFYASAIETARFIGPAMAGWIVAASNTGVVFLMNGASFIAVIISLLQVRAQQIRRPPTGNALTNFVEAVRYVPQQPRILDLMSCSLMISLFVFGSLELTSAIADQVLQGGPELVGYILGASGAGALVGSLVVAPFFQKAQRAGLMLVLTVIWAGVWLIAASFSYSAPLTVLCVFFNGISIPLVLANVSGLIQMLSPVTMRARLISFQTMISFGMRPLGALFIGFLGSALGPLAAMRFNGILVTVISLAILLLRRDFREWLVAKGGN
jgi:MFS family permease